MGWVALAIVSGVGCLGAETRPPVLQPFDPTTQEPERRPQETGAPDATVHEAVVPDAAVKEAGAPEVAVAPSQEPLSGGFADLSGEMAVSPPFAVAGLDSPTGPEATLGSIADLDGDGRAEVLLAVSPVPSPDFDSSPRF